jgi:hypothetical protein
MNGWEFAGTIAITFAVQGAAGGIGDSLIARSVKRRQLAVKEKPKARASLVVHLLSLIVGGGAFMGLGGSFGDVGVPMSHGARVLLFGLTGSSAAVLSAIQQQLRITLARPSGAWRLVASLLFLLVGLPAIGHVSETSWQHLEYEGSTGFLWAYLAFSAVWVLVALAPLARLVSGRLRYSKWLGALGLPFVCTAVFASLHLVTDDWYEVGELLPTLCWMLLSFALGSAVILRLARLPLTMQETPATNQTGAARRDRNGTAED